VTKRTCLGRFGAQLLHRGSEVGERRRADVGALRIAEVHQHHLAAEIGERARLSVVIGQAQLAAERRAGDVDRLEGRLRRAEPVATGGQHGDKDRRRGARHGTHEVNKGR
jgi:hypothetical protein